MEAAAALRKARIDALRRLRQAEDAHDQRAIEENEFGRAVKASFRSSVPPPGALSQQPTVLDTLEHDIAGLQERVIAEDEAEQEKKLDLAAIAPKRPNWDLRRAYDQRVAQLERRTKLAIRALIVERVRASQGTSDDAEAEATARLVAEAGASDEEEEDEEE
ncbi:hypothetical protein GLX27_000546 [Malassezia furfur]|uniref:Coiled-coil domain-containing protein 12 n=1 Tax=Malassezia furfur TaxID=55194 RepID=A0ABY8EN93_MALFU|nr:hypothetical protein CBS14141_001776 [Malassezia furfur]WFD45920.1 hypothetical protein GLX27_000546 [Malassezia furfur]